MTVVGGCGSCLLDRDRHACTVSVDDLAEGGGVVAVQGLEDPPLGPDGPALVEPEVFKVAVCDEVAGPGMCNLVGNHVSV